MDTIISHAWDVTPQEAIAIQEKLRHMIICKDQLTEVNWVAGVDVGFEKQGTVTRAAVAVLNFPELELHEGTIARCPTTFPYIPGLLSFREVPAILDALAKVSQRPDLLICDGQGLAHPRRFGLACHLGLLANLPAIGVGKSRLVGKNEPVGKTRGDRQPLYDSDEVIGGLGVSIRPLLPFISYLRFDFAYGEPGEGISFFLGAGNKLGKHKKRVR